MSFADKYRNAGVRTAAGGSKEKKKLPPLPKCRCGNDCQIHMGNGVSLCDSCWDKKRELDFLETSQLRDRIDVPSRVPGEPASAYFHRAMRASTRKA